MMDRKNDLLARAKTRIEEAIARRKSQGLTYARISSFFIDPSVRMEIDNYLAVNGYKVSKTGQFNNSTTYDLVITW